jgi:autophagy-related protein 13
MLDETDVLSDDLQEWRRPDLSDEPPPPLEIEVSTRLT